jgi:hypothetical protein
MSLASGFKSMTGRQTASGKRIRYVLAAGSTTPLVPGQIKAIAVMTSDLTCTSPDTAIGAHNFKMFFPVAQGGMLPTGNSFELPGLDFSELQHVRAFLAADPFLLHVDKLKSRNP